ncbi:G4 quadruplex nucleic acid binding protein [Zalaria obscura]|uniref:G4 quadruplex nucleic acid binding protein n=1 Tax=Zalaria obscura TaxID=2024903 RepID=A0ACC3SM32_9PEZI
MASLSTLDTKAKSLIEKSYPQAKDVVDDAVKASTAAFPQAEYSTAEKTEVEQWLITSSHIGSSSEDAAKTAERLSSLNTHLSTRTTVLGSKPSIADVALYSQLAPVVSSWSAEQRTGEQGYHHITRYVDFVQNAPLFGLQLSEEEKVKIDPSNVISKIKPIDAKAEKERKKKEKELAAAGAEGAAAAGATVTSAASQDTQAQSKKEQAKDKAASTGDKIANAVGAETPGVAKEHKKEKKEKKPKPQKNAPAPAKPLSPALIDLRVGHILKAIQHPDADSLYVSTIAVGDPAGTDNTTEYEGQICRIVCSGLNGLVPLQEMQGRKIVAVCNLKPVTMRGIKSAAMVLAASPRLAEGEEDHHAGPVELVNPPEGAAAGDRVFFEGWEGEPEGVLNPKKKIWESCQPGFTTTDSLEVAFDSSAVAQLAESGKPVGKLQTKAGLCTVKSLKGATVR